MISYKKEEGVYFMYNTHTQGKGFVILLEQEEESTVQKGRFDGAGYVQNMLRKKDGQNTDTKGMENVMMLENKYRKKAVLSQKKHVPD